MGSGIGTLLFFQVLGEASNHAAWPRRAYACKKKAPPFWCGVCSCRVAGGAFRYLGMANKVSMFFSVLFLLSYALAKNQSVLFN